MFEDVDVDCPTVGEDWQSHSTSERLRIVEEAIRNQGVGDLIEVTRVLEDGQVYVSLVQEVPVERRGPLLLDCEAQLKRTVDPGIVLWVEPLGDRNRLRHLRGVDVKLSLSGEV